MRKTICVALALLLVISCFVSCGASKAIPENTSCETIMNAVRTVEDSSDNEKLYLKSEENLDALSMGLWADGLYEECEELELLSDYAIFLGAGVKTYEITVLKAKTKGDVASLVDLIERRKKTLELGDKGMYDPDFELRMSNSVVYKDGLFVMLLITEDNDAAIKAIEQLKE